MPAEIFVPARGFTRDGHVVKLDSGEYKRVKDHIHLVYSDVESGYHEDGFKGGYLEGTDGSVSFRFYSHTRALSAADTFISKGLKEESGVRPTREGVRRSQREMIRRRGR